ncbi:hypothetical protein HU200_050697 [Digitaria exilis]|uniref:MATH domain-containing protein n=1 Tax=Digitaria exilis TaxID=1010633 RepID=A0A835AU57_9POAL|nr:hypothetical protein HU200_050697 [Digitaria exilis]
MFNQVSGEDKQYTNTGIALSFLSRYSYASDQNAYDLVVGVFARRLDRNWSWSSIDLLSYDKFLDPSYGFLIADTCVFGVEIVDIAPIQRCYLNSTCLLAKANSFGGDIVGIDPNPTLRRPLHSNNTGRFRWTIQGLSTERKVKPRICEKFSACRYNWIISILAGSSHSLGSERLHIYVRLSLSHIFCQLFGRINICLINQLTGKHIEKSYCGIFHAGINHGCADVMPLQTFFNEEEGFLVQDCCIVEVEVTVLSQAPAASFEHRCSHRPLDGFPQKW